MKRTALAILILIIATVILYFAGCEKSDSSNKDSEPIVSAQEKAPERFILRNIYGKKYRWSQFAGKPFMINFWATWCGPCRAETPALIKLYTEFQPRGLEIVAISLDTERTRDRVVPFIDEYKIPWIVLYGELNVIDEFSLGTSIPVTLFFDAEGNETARLIGAQPELVFRRELEKLYPSKPEI